MKDHSLSVTDYVNKLRSFELALEASLEAKDWDRMMAVNQELQVFFQQLSDAGLTDQPGIQEALARVQVLCSALIQVCVRHRADTLSVIKKNRNDSSALSSYQRASSLRGP
ncbi:hypothetical protein [Endozoicomonas sp. SCSIO W0465]|uniref:hypothetical protein n=1 Tax=Endozoicomonas sp. SCSIO W0465 TaxID=2918516 RepID=UPI002076042B|nr:hypothetical protein [Endozoicomonas sp. SCSIO W0465]USE37648.1 hypothetical protein MJO57_05415 [Endozoicomonas sp. SCSIO W0465]